MDRTNTFEKSKIFKVATNKVVTNVYLDAFNIEKVRFQNASFKDKNSVNCYVDFSTIALLAADAASGRLFKKIEEDPYNRYTVTMGGSKKGPDGKPIARQMYLGRSGNNIFINMQEGPGKLGETGLIIPDGDPTLKIGVPCSIDSFREMILYTHDCVNAYLGPMIHRLVKEAEDDRKKAMS